MSDSSNQPSTGTTVIALMQIAGLMVFGYEFARSWLAEAKTLEEEARNGTNQSK